MIRSFVQANCAFPIEFFFHVGFVTMLTNLVFGHFTVFSKNKDRNEMDCNLSTSILDLRSNTF